MSFLGLDLEAVLKHARQLEVGAANELFNVLTQMQGLMPQLMNVWQGEDATKFNEEWSHHHAALTQVHHSIQGVANSVAAAAKAQAQTSGM